MNAINKMRLIHISGSRRCDGNSGGVEKFGWYLQRATGCELLTDQMYRGEFKRGDIFIVDGDHGKNIPKEAPIISVAHGTWAALHRRWLTESIGDYTEMSQIERWHQDNVFIVSISPGVTSELKTFCDVEPDIEILHGIDDNPYYGPKQLGLREKPIVIYASKSPGKGYGMIPQLQKLLPDFEFRYLNAKIGEEYQKFSEGSIFLHMSLSDGNSYACLEAMNQNLPCVVTNVGLFQFFEDESDLGRILPYTSKAEDFAEAILDVYNNQTKFNPRMWVGGNAFFEKFTSDWQAFIRKVYEEWYQEKL